MAIEALERAIEFRPRETRRKVSSSPIRLDRVQRVQMGQEIFEYLALKRGLTLDQALDRERTGKQESQSKVKEDFLLLNLELLHLTQEEVAKVFRRSKTVVSHHNRILKLKANRGLLKPSLT